MKNNSFNASVLEKILVMGLIPLIGVSGFMVYSLFGTLEQKSKQASHATIDSEVSKQNVDELKELEMKLNKNQEIAKRAAAIVADSKQYRYQDQIVNDINTYASAAGVTILGFDFSESGSSAEGSNSTESSTESSSGNPSAAPVEQPKQSVAGLKTVNASLQLDSPIPLRNFLIFLKYIEQNVTKMQITGVTLTPAENPNLISNPTINITVYTR